MVWKVMLLVCCIAFFTSGEVHAATYSTYDGNISSTYLDMFDSMSIPLGSEYVLFRSSQYEYVLFYGDLKLDGTSFSGTGKCVSIVQTTYNNYNNYYSINVVEDNDFYLAASDKVVYSSLGSYPSMYEEGYYFQGIIVLLLAIIVLTNVLRPVFTFSMRNRNGVIS